MVAAGGGSIVNVASTSGLAADPSRTAYCASKAGILGLTRAMALDLGRHGVRVNAVCPGLVRTPLTEPYFADRAFVEGLADVSPLGRAADPAEVADVVAFLAGDGARHITGVALPVDGGFLAGKSWGGGAFTAPPPETSPRPTRSLDWP
jgi:NAD(P)-dependent dehydrogenase (short-subunit alcohol dehydrogenase family)